MDDIELVGKPGLAARLSLTDVETLRFHPATFRGNRDFTDAAQSRASYGSTRDLTSRILHLHNGLRLGTP